MCPRARPTVSEGPTHGRCHIVPWTPECMALPLAKRSILLGSVRRGIVPVLILVGATATTLLLVPVAFFAAAVAMVLFRSSRAREVYAAIDGPILVVLAALIPVSDSLRTTGATDVIAGWLAKLGSALPPAGEFLLPFCSRNAQVKSIIINAVSQSQTVAFSSA